MKLVDYKIIRGAVSAELCGFLSSYLLLKKEVYKTTARAGYVPMGYTGIGTLDDKQVPGAFSIYGDSAFDTLLPKVLPMMCKETNIKLIPTYSYARSYSTGQELEKHIDRMTCDISTTLNIGGDLWPIYFLIKKKKVQVDLKPGDMVLYRGKKIPHWRDVFKGRYCNQVFLHYNDEQKGEPPYDNRLHLGLPARFSRGEIKLVRKVGE